MGSRWITIVSSLGTLLPCIFAGSNIHCLTATATAALTDSSCTDPSSRACAAATCPDSSILTLTATSVGSEILEIPKLFASGAAHFIGRAGTYADVDCAVYLEADSRAAANGFIGEPVVSREGPGARFVAGTGLAEGSSGGLGNVSCAKRSGCAPLTLPIGSDGGFCAASNCRSDDRCGGSAAALSLGDGRLTD